jgi:L,D-transpeptidase YcbB
MNVPAAERRRQVELNLERWRWLPESLGEKYIEVNIPAYELEVVEHGVPTLAMRVVVGKPYLPTPAFSDEIERLVLNPAWHVPSSIVASEILPAIEKDPGYLDKENMEIVGGSGRTLQVRQRPGPGNSLGQVKFDLPNRWNVYLHDTPADRLFARVTRSLSHGCIRLERPLDLATLLLAGEKGWSRERIEEAIARGATLAVPLAQPVPVHIVYWTAWVGRDGELRFRDDPYRVDAKLAQALRSAA